METVNVDYRGFVLSHLKVPLMSGEFAINVGSNDPSLAEKLTLNDKIVVDHMSVDRAIAEAKRRIDRLLQPA